MWTPPPSTPPNITGSTTSICDSLFPHLGAFVFLDQAVVVEDRAFRFTSLFRVVSSALMALSLIASLGRRINQASDCPPS